MACEPRPRPRPGSGEVTLTVNAAGICGSELSSFTGASTRRLPGRVFGHELAGTIGEVGSGVPGELIGRRVTVNPLTSCGRCLTCLTGRANACPSRTLLGMQIDGGFAEEVAVPASAVFDLGELDDIGGSLTEPLANAVHVTRLLPPLVGKHVIVYGAGAIGLCVIAMLSASGAAEITVIDPVARRRDIARASGADAALSPDDAGDLSADHVVDAAGVTSARRDAIDRCAGGGTIMLLGLHTAESELPINAAVAKELRLQCSYAYTPEDFEIALRTLQSGAVRYQPWITEMPLADGQAAFRALVERPNEATKIILRPGAAPAGDAQSADQSDHDQRPA
jgi:2-desacetyl-2-hydroxyethyl bacteriochlorophyllide A dehydrogenase